MNRMMPRCDPRKSKLVHDGENLFDLGLVKTNHLQFTVHHFLTVGVAFQSHVTDDTTLTEAYSQPQ